MASSTKYKTPQRNFTRHIEVSSDASPDSRETKPSSDPAEKTLDSSRVQEVDASYLLVSEADTSLSPTHSNPGLQDDTAFTDRAETVVAETRLGKQSSAPAADGEAERCAVSCAPFSLLLVHVLMTVCSRTRMIFRGMMQQSLHARSSSCRARKR